MNRPSVDHYWQDLCEFDRAWDRRKGWTVGKQFATPAKRVVLRDEKPSFIARAWAVLNTPISELVF